jgi:hypothetical protein
MSKCLGVHFVKKKRKIKKERLHKEVFCGVEQERMEEEARDLREHEIDDQWRKHLLDSEIEKQQLIQQLEEAAKMRAEKGKKKKKGGMGGKKKK